LTQLRPHRESQIGSDFQDGSGQEGKAFFSAAFIGRRTSAAAAAPPISRATPRGLSNEGR